MNEEVSLHVVSAAAGAETKSWHSHPVHVLRVTSDNSEKQGLLEELEPKPLRYNDISVVVHTSLEAMTAAADPVSHYINFPPHQDNTPWQKALGRASFYAFWVRHTSAHRTWTINGGQSYVIWALPPACSGPSTPMEGVWASLYDVLSSAYHTEEEKKRREELETKGKACADAIFGDRIKDMHVVGGLATDPERQGRGYASTLVRMVTDQADKENRATWLTSSNITVNTTFYNSLGFYTQGRFWLGEDNPNWHKAPIPVDIMVREPKGQMSSEKASNYLVYT